MAVDASALMAIVFDESEASTCIAALKAEENVFISASSLAESPIVSAWRNVVAELAGMVHGFEGAFDRITCRAREMRRQAVYSGNLDHHSARAGVAGRPRPLFAEYPFLTPETFNSIGVALRSGFGR